jgi:UDP-N-acetylmuramoyl-tripeptide--D-alanyl-D-alanine ligase
VIVRPINLTAAAIAAAAAGRVLAGDPRRTFTAAAIDSRDVPKDALFVALPGSRVDGHDFAAAALAAGAGGVLTSHDLPATLPAGVVEIRVDDTLAAMQAVAAAWRHDLHATVIGVAGSNGKTTTKETLAAVLATRGPTVATPRNENSQIGAPLTILGAPADTEFLVLELGTSAPGELSRLGAMAQPDLAVITAAYAEHLEWLGDVAGVVAAETEILDHLRPGALAVVGSGEPLLLEVARRCDHLDLRSLGTQTDDDWRLDAIRLERDGTHFTLSGPGQPARPWHVPLLGGPAAWAGAFAIAVASELGLDGASIQRGLDGVAAVAHRLVPVAHPRLPLFVVDDTYNSNPASCRAAIETAVALARPDDRVLLVLGDMLELGDASADSHREVGAEAARRAPGATLIAVGPESRLLADAARRDGVTVHETPDAGAAAALLETILADGRPSTVLAKGSRGIGLDRVVARLLSL